MPPVRHGRTGEWTRLVLLPAVRGERAAALVQVAEQPVLGTGG
jgi:hypothetical protein